MKCIDLGDEIYACYLGLQKVMVDDPVKFMEKLKASFPHIIVQAINAKFVAGHRHLELVLKQTLEAKRRGILYAKSPELDLLVRISCDTQISRAIKTVGIEKGVQNIVIVALGKKECAESIKDGLRSYGKISDEVIQLTTDKMRTLIRHHGLSKSYVKAVVQTKARLASVLAERAAVLASEKVKKK